MASLQLVASVESSRWRPELLVPLFNVRAGHCLCNAFVDKTTGYYIPHPPAPPLPSLRLSVNCDLCRKQNKAEAKGLLEVTVILSGDKTRRNMPGIAFRRAKARLMKKGGNAGLANRGAGYRGDTDGGTGDQASARATSSGADASSELKQEDKDKLGDELMRGAQLYRHKIARALSRVSEEDSMSLGSSFVNSSRTFGRDLESGGDGGSFRSPMVLCKGVEEKAPTGVGGGGGNKELPWSPIGGGRAGGSGGDSDRTIQTLNELRQTRSDPRRHKEASQSTGRSDSAREPSIATRVAGCSRNLWGGGEDGGGSGGEDSGDDYGSPIPLRHSRGDVRSTCSSPTLSRQEATRDLRDASSDRSGCVSEGARTYNGSSCEKATRGSIHLMGPFSRENVGRGRWLQSVRKKESSSQANRGSGGGGGGKLVRPTLDQSSSSKIDIVAYNPGEEVQSDATTVAGSCGRPSRSHRRGSSENPSSPSGVNTHSNSAPTITRHESSRNSSSRDMAAEHMPGSSLEDVRTLLYNATGLASEYWVCRPYLPNANELAGIQDV